MTVIVVTKVSPSLRGHLTRWMLELKPGVFVGSLSRRVRDWLWERVKVAKKAGACALAYATRCEQGFRCELAGDPRRTLINVDGLMLVRRIQRTVGGGR